jgi:PBSX family phage terminase large subunit
MQVIKPYQKLWTTERTYAIIKSGRDAGKSTSIAKRVFDRFISLELDILITRSNYGDLYKSMYNEIIAIINEENYTQFIIERRKPLKIINKLNGNVIFFEGIGGADLSRTKGFKPNKKLSLIVVDEMQQLPEQTNLEQALATFRRHLDDDEGQVLLAFNPEPQNAHWANEYYRACENDDDFLCLFTSYLDIAGVLSPKDLKAILREKEVNPSNYRYLYLGETAGLFGGVYHTFNRDIHFLKEDIMQNLVKKIGIHSVIIGIDAATTIDSTSFIPMLILNNGQVLSVNQFFQNPKINGAMSNDKLYPYVKQWLDGMLLRWNIPRTMMIQMVFDSANADLRIVMANRLTNRFICSAYSQKNIIQLAQVMNNAFSRNVLYILDEGGIQNYMTGRFEYNYNPLLLALESVLWNDTGKKFDPIIPNDTTDAMTYGIAFYFKNPNALYFPPKKDFYERSEIDVGRNI